MLFEIQEKLERFDSPRDRDLVREVRQLIYRKKIESILSLYDLMIKLFRLELFWQSVVNGAEVFQGSELSVFDLII